MQKRNSKPAENARALRIKECCARYGLGRALMRRTAEKAGAVIRIGRAVLFDVEKLDAYFSRLTK